MRIKPPKIESLKILKIRVSHKGERTLTRSEKEALKKERGYKCDKCGEKKPSKYLIVDHKKQVAEYKSKSLNVGYLEFYDKKRKKPPHDWKRNLQVLCLECNTDKTLKERKTKKRRTKKKLYYPFSKPLNIKSRF